MSPNRPRMTAPLSQADKRAGSSTTLQRDERIMWPTSVGETHSQWSKPVVPMTRGRASWLTESARLVPRVGSEHAGRRDATSR